MLRQNFKLWAIYTELENKKTGRAVSITGEIVKLQDKKGRPIYSHICLLRYPPVFKSDNHTITLDINSIKNNASGILFKLKDREIIRNVGGADLMLYGEYKGKWQVVVNNPLNPTIGSNSRLVGYYNTQAKALQALWDERESIIC